MLGSTVGNQFQQPVSSSQTSTMNTNFADKLRSEALGWSSFIDIGYF